MDPTHKFIRVLRINDFLRAYITYTHTSSAENFVSLDDDGCV